MDTERDKRQTKMTKVQATIDRPSREERTTAQFTIVEKPAPEPVKVHVAVGKGPSPRGAAGEESQPVYLTDTATKRDDREIVTALKARIAALEASGSWPELRKDLQRAVDEIEWLRAAK